MDFEDLGFPPPEQTSSPSPPRTPVELPTPHELPPQAAQPSQVTQRPLPLPSPHAARAKAGLGAIVAAIGAGVGGGLAGPLGALAGLTGVGAARNLYRAQGIASTDPSERSDAARSLALGLIGVAIVGVVGYKLYTSSKEK